MAVIFPEMPPSLRPMMPEAFWAWWQKLRSWLKQTTIDGMAIPTYANNAAALAGGLVAGAFYRTSTGVLMVVY